MLACVHAAVLTGIEATVVEVECDIANGLPTFTVVGLADVAVREARDRVRAALHHSGHPYPMQRITVNLAPSNLPKHGTSLDLAVALGLLAAQECAPARGAQGRLFLGELGLGGEVRPVRGVLASAEAARASGFREVVCAVENAGEAALAGLPAVGVATLKEAVAVLQGRGPDPQVGDAQALLDGSVDVELDLAQVRDQDHAKRALEVAAAGGHNLLMSGPPGSGKTLLARALPGILPSLTVDEALEVTRIHSAAGFLEPGEALVRTRPFRAPHHGVSVAGLIGGGSVVSRPGEVSLAHRGILFLDELPEFPRVCLESLRQPLEDGRVTVVRARHAVTYPSRFQLVAAMNPCPCGNGGGPSPCRCLPRALDGYKQRLSGPLLDRIDLRVEVPRVETDQLLATEQGETSADVRKRVELARERGAARGSGCGATCNAELPVGELMHSVDLDDQAIRLLARYSTRLRLSARAVHKVLRIARTIADLEGTEAVGSVQISEAVSYRVIDPNASEQVS